MKQAPKDPKKRSKALRLAWDKEQAKQANSFVTPLQAQPTGSIRQLPLDERRALRQTVKEALDSLYPPKDSSKWSWSGPIRGRS